MLGLIVFLFSPSGIKYSKYGPVDFNAQEVRNSTRLYESDKTYRCITGWRILTGDEARTCPANGTWTGQPLECESKLLELLTLRYA